ncbi:hypothetical protein MESS4_60129 [Mesorhizobium sp. STM 4661]|nr:hypothetical protein MESS4_60129 [Mesorhizobium sp. STM 4661]
MGVRGLKAPRLLSGLSPRARGDGRTYLHQAVCGLDQTPLRAYPAAQRDILGQHFFRAFKRELGPFDALPGIGHRASVGFHGVHHDLPTHGGPDRSLVPHQTHHWRHASKKHPCKHVFSQAFSAPVAGA